MRRAAVRRGEYRPVPVSLAYIYLYELLNGIGTAGPEDSLAKLRAFETGYPDAGDPGMRRNLRRWMTELAVVSGLPPETVRQYADGDMLRTDDALAVLKRPDGHGDDELLDALCVMGGDRLRTSPVLQAPEGRRLFALVWRRAAAGYREEGKSIFTACFGARRPRRWYPLGNALYCPVRKPEPLICQLSECRKYTFRDGQWQEHCFRKEHFDRKKLSGLLHETERRLRLYLGAGRPLKEKPEDAWAAPFIEEVLEAHRREKAQAASRAVSIRFGRLDRIRADAAETRDSLLTEEERQAPEPEPVSPPVPPGSAEAAPLTSGQRELLAALLRGESVTERIAARHGMAAVIADGINEALLDLLGDSAVECGEGGITLIEDYREEIARLIGGED